MVFEKKSAEQKVSRWFYNRFRKLVCILLSFMVHHQNSMLKG